MTGVVRKMIPRRCAWLSATLFASCNTVVDFTVPAHNTELVATSFFTPDSTWSVSVYGSQSINTNRNTTSMVIEGAIVQILQGNQVVDNLQLASDGRYRSTRHHKPESGTYYTLSVGASGLQPVEAVAAAPHRPEVLEFEVEKLLSPIGIDERRPDTHSIELRIADAPGRSIYRIAFFEYAERGGDQNGFGLASFACGDPSVYHEYDEVNREDRDSSTIFGGAAILPDDLFQGGSHNVIITFRQRRGIHRYKVLVSSLSTEYFEYQRTRLANPQSDYIWDDFITPSPIYTNIEGGFGVFAGYADTLLTFELNPNPTSS